MREIFISAASVSHLIANWTDRVTIIAIIGINSIPRRYKRIGSVEKAFYYQRL